ncbi:SE-cephalotoxin-like [Denticeps clupeoides]|uniref:SE-cephalotoxin-like n=1 Tax=Denticeps clupeoides TaxID=299321 RepID=UPI0010A3B836|nr:SE-cephalotoxin-like [Denticeps clupeoides]
MGISKTFIAVVYLLLYNSFSTANVDPDQISKVEKGLTTCEELLKGLDELTQAVTKTKEATQMIQKVLKVFDGLAKVAASLHFFGALLSFIFAFIPQSDPTLEFLKEQFAEVNRKLDSMSLQISTLGKEMEWASYASVYSKDENNIRNSWAKLKEFIASASAAKTQEQKTRLAERFTTFYESTATESSVADLYKYITESHGSSLNKNLLQLVVQKSSGDFAILTQYSSYFTALMVSGLQLNLFYYKLKGYDAAAKAKEAEGELGNVLSAIQDALINCADGFETWAEKDITKIGTQPFSDNKDLASKIKKHLDQKFKWYEWTVIAHPKDAKGEYSSGSSISLLVQDKTVVHVIHQEKGYTVNQRIKDDIKVQFKDVFPQITCETMKDELVQIVGIKIMNHVQFLHAVLIRDDFAQTKAADIELQCSTPLYFIDTDHRTIRLFLKSKDVVENPPCSKLKCQNGECKQIKDTTEGFCKCQKMFHGPTCEMSVQNEIDYLAVEDQIDSIIYQFVPDMTSVYHSIKDLKEYTRHLIETVQHDIHWTQVLVKYNSVIEKFRYIVTLHNHLRDGTVTQQQFVSDVGLFSSGENKFTFMFTQYNHMMKGSGFGYNQNILDAFRNSLLLDPQGKNPVECSKAYRDKMDDFLRYMFALEKEAILSWMKYLVVTGNLKESRLLMDMSKKFTEEQRGVFNKKGCGSLKAENLANEFCEKPYHSTDLQQVRVQCAEGYVAAPSKVTCSQGTWDSTPVCYVVPPGGSVSCTHAKTTTTCAASCPAGWKFRLADKQVSTCDRQPCSSFRPEKCDTCTKSAVCKDDEVCDNGKCVPGCNVLTCGVNARCSTTNHDPKCSCISPWKGDDPRQGCRYQDLRWVPTSGIPANAVYSMKGYAVCRATDPDGGISSGWIWQNRYCNYEWGWKEHRATSYEVLVDPCGGKGVEWVSGVQSNMVFVAEAKRWAGVMVYVCSAKNNGVPGKLFNTRSGFLCHIGYENVGYRDEHYYSLVKRACV